MTKAPAMPANLKMGEWTFLLRHRNKGFQNTIQGRGLIPGISQSWKVFAGVPPSGFHWLDGERAFGHLCKPFDFLDHTILLRRA